jgi:23S rRNA pseudouridine2605 synthase
MSQTRSTGCVRLQRFLSDAGVVSRKHAEEYIVDGRVLVNGKTVRELPAFVDPEHDTVLVDGTPVRTAPPVYFIVNKPKGVVSGQRERSGHKRVSELLPPMRQKPMPAGQLDEEDSGLLLMTSDGRLAQRIAHPRFGLTKTYWVETKGRAPDDIARRLLQGVHLAEGKARALKVEITFVANDRSTLSVTVREGRKRQVRRMLARLGLPVRNLKCTDIGPLKLKGLPLGASRPLTPSELKALRTALTHSAESLRRPRGPARTRPAAPGTAKQPARTPERPAARRPEGDQPPSRRIIS